MPPNLASESLPARLTAISIYCTAPRIATPLQLIHPLVQLLGLRIAFLVVYLVSKALLYWGAMRFIQVVVKDRLVTLVLLFIALCRVPVGGNSIFHLNEAFLTSYCACGLTCWPWSESSAAACSRRRHCWSVVSCCIP